MFLSGISPTVVQKKINSRSGLLTERRGCFSLSLSLSLSLAEAQ